MLPLDLKLERGPLPENAWQRQMTMSQYLGLSSISRTRCVASSPTRSRRTSASTSPPRRSGAEGLLGHRGLHGLGTAPVARRSHCPKPRFLCNRGETGPWRGPSFRHLTVTLSSPGKSSPIPTSSCDFLSINRPSVTTKKADRDNRAFGARNLRLGGLWSPRNARQSRPSRRQRIQTAR